ncbi:MAG: hypothetical protein Q9166_007256 [cf. Caloplaca sp. 2 TL-2023]
MSVLRRNEQFWAKEREEWERISIELAQSYGFSTVEEYDDHEAERLEPHPFDFFCPQTLVNCRSMDIPDLMNYLNHQNILKPEELKIKEGDRSKRLDQDILERHWVQKSQERPLRVPFWANADGVVQQIIRQDSRQNRPAPPLLPCVHNPYCGNPFCGEPISSSPSVEDITMTSTNTSLNEDETDRLAFLLLKSHHREKLWQEIIAPGSNIKDERARSPHEVPRRGQRT